VDALTVLFFLFKFYNFLIDVKSSNILVIFVGKRNYIYEEYNEKLQ